MKGLILCAGRGTRLYPITINHPKTLIPVANIPILQSCIEKLIEQGIYEIGIVLHPSQETVIKAKFEAGESWGATLTYIYQTEAKGISDAAKQARDYIGEEAFLLLLGDNLISESLSELKRDVEERGSCASLLLAEVANPRDYGVAKVSDGRIVELVEKPQNPISNLAVLGAYAFKPTVFEAISSIAPSARGEYEITDAIQWLIDHNCAVTYHITEKLNMDVGTMERWLEANQMMLDELESDEMIHESAILHNCTIVEPISIDKGCVLKDCVIGPYVSISADSYIDHCKIENSILLSGVHLKHISYLLKNTIIGINSVLAGIKENGEGSDQ
ncbi:glucose-1-phosphate thymidylyltransferase [Paenibacillus castaneae]|uniref:sugar phosphate nucleotidyltransferase n=1 Tax=Paenibacillus castaneae TaxID=474957 RepID=UPI000C9C5625|nr:sugar phosphate nucleotidyltransferase [Paenibacillus castaneae]NIK77615.1 glucose-1-phosphate thymidylyltransferase [Paenibacillus castaneae]